MFSKRCKQLITFSIASLTLLNLAGACSNNSYASHTNYQNYRITRTNYQANVLHQRIINSLKSQKKIIRKSNTKHIKPNNVLHYRILKSLNELKSYYHKNNISVKHNQHVNTKNSKEIKVLRNRIKNDVRELKSYY